MLLDGPTDGERFLASVGLMLARAWRPRDIAVMDNLRHKVAGVRQAIGACEAELRYLSLNPIENAFAKLKAHVRKSASWTIDTLNVPPPMPCDSSSLTNVQTSSRTPDPDWIKRNPRKSEMAFG